MGLLNFIKQKLLYNTSYAGIQARSAPYDKTAWEYDIFRATVDAIATHAAKGRISHIVVDKKTEKTIKTVCDSKVAKLINVRANPIMSGFDFKYRFFANLETQTTAIAYIEFDIIGHKRVPVAIYPVDNTSFEFRKVTGGGYAVLFTDYEGRQCVLGLEDCVVVRKFYNTRQAGGDGNAPIYSVLDMAKASDDGFIQSLNGANKIRGILVNKKAMLDPKDVKTGQDEFTRRFQAAAKDGGIVATDSMEDFKPLEWKSYSANAAQMKEISDRIFTYLRTPLEVVQNRYSEETGQSWYEGKIEPMWEALTEALQNVVFSDTEYSFGNRIVMNGGILMGTSIKTRVELLKMTQNIPMLTRNEKRELLGYPPVEDGDVIDVTLNTVKDKDQTEYQTGKEDENGKSEGSGNDAGDGNGSGDAKDESE